MGRNNVSLIYRRFHSQPWTLKNIVSWRIGGLHQVAYEAHIKSCCGEGNTLAIKYSFYNTLLSLRIAIRLKRGSKKRQLPWNNASFGHPWLTSSNWKRFICP